MSRSIALEQLIWICSCVNESPAESGSQGEAARLPGCSAIKAHTVATQHPGCPGQGSWRGKAPRPGRIWEEKQVRNVQKAEKIQRGFLKAGLWQAELIPAWF